MAELEFKKIELGDDQDVAAKKIVENDELNRDIALSRIALSFWNGDPNGLRYVNFNTKEGVISFPSGFAVLFNTKGGAPSNQYIRVPEDISIPLYPAVSHSNTELAASSCGYLWINRETAEIRHIWWRAETPIAVLKNWVMFAVIKRDTASTTKTNSVQVHATFKYMVNNVDPENKHINSAVVPWLNNSKNIKIDTNTLTIEKAGFTIILDDKRYNFVGNEDLIIDGGTGSPTRRYVWVDLTLATPYSSSLDSNTYSWDSIEGLITVTSEGFQHANKFLLATSYMDNWMFPNGGAADIVAAERDVLRLNYISPFLQRRASDDDDKITFDIAANKITVPAGFGIVKKNEEGGAFLGNQYLTITPTEIDDETPYASSLSWLMFNPYTGKVTNRVWSAKQDPEAVLIGTIHRTTPSLSSVGNITVTSLFKYRILGGEAEDGSTPGIITRNSDITAFVQGATNYMQGGPGGAMQTRFSLCWTSDTHSNTRTCSNFVTYLNSNPGLDYGIVTGDLAAGNFNSSVQSMLDALLSSSKPIIPLVGNHDCGNSFLVSQSGSHEQVYTKFIAPFIPKLELSEDENTGKNYYYKDFKDKKIRLINIYEYDAPLDLKDGGLEYKIFRGNTVYSQIQIDWFINLLQNTPSDYGVIVATHSPQVSASGEARINRDKGFTSNTVVDDYYNSMYYINGSPLVDIIAAWKSGGSLDLAYSFKNEASYLAPLEVRADFSSRGSSEFICFLSGHTHRDIVGTMVNGNTPFIVVTCGTDDIGQTSYDDLPRVSSSRTEDAFNILSVDRQKRLIYIVRVGANANNELDPRKFMKIGY